MAADNSRSPSGGGDAAKALAIFSQTRRLGDLIFTSGQGPVNMKTGVYSPLSIEEETRLTLDNLKDALEEAGASMDRVLKITVYLADMSDYAAFNKVYAGYFTPPMPARSCIAAAGLAFGMKVELDAVASAPGR